MENGDFKGANTINGTLLFSKGKSYNIFTTQTFGASGTLNAIGDCNNYIGINNGAFSKASGVISVDWAVIQDNDGTGGATYNTSNTILSGTTGWNNGTLNTADFHFKATNSNKWGDPENWYGTYVSGVFSNPLNCIPGPGNDVFFYPNSFITYPDLLMDELNAYCHTMNWGSGTYSTQVLVTSTSTNNKLSIYGGLTFIDNIDLDWQFDGDVDFRAPDPTVQLPQTSYDITSKGQVFLRDVTFNGGVTMEWHLKDDFETALFQINAFGSPTLKVSQGKFFSGGNKITTGAFRSEGSSTRTVDMADSEVRIITETVGSTYVGWKTSSSGNGQPLTLNMSNTELHLDNTNTNGNVQLIATEGDFNEVYFDNTELGVISGGDNDFNLAEFTGHGAIFGNNDFHVLRFSPGKTYDLEIGKTQSIVTINSVPGLFDATGTNGTGLINIVSTVPAVQAFIEQVDGTICIDFCNITDIDVSQPGAGTLAFAGANSNNISNNSGWAFDHCVAPVITGCAETSVDFNTLVNGTSFDWTFGDGQTGTGTPISHTYSAAGTYNAFVIISTFSQGVASEDGRNFIVEISESCCTAGDDPNYTEKSGTISSYENWPDKVFVSDDVFVTGTGELDITNSDVVFAAGVGIYFQEESRLSATNSTFRACTGDDIWTGLHFDNDAGGKITESVLINAQNAITASTNGIVECVNNQFLNNQTAIYIEAEAEVAVGHVINGNTVTINKDNPFSDPLAVTAIDFNGIIVNGVSLEATVSQNNFVYTSSISTIDKVHGIQNMVGALTASDNVFTNQALAYIQMEPIAVSSFENNVVNYNAEALNLYSSVADLVAVTVDGSVAPTLIASNELNLSYDVTNNSKGIYVSNSSAVVIHANEIDGFKEGIQGIGMEGLINSNEVGHSNSGITITNSSNLGVQDNIVESSTEFGMYFGNSFEAVRVWRNTVKNDPDVSGSVGIKYFIDTPTQPTNIEFIDNCVFDTEVAMDFSNTSSDQCLIIPFVRGNYLFSYTSYGLFVHEFNGFVGTGGSDPGRNSFLSNNIAIASDVYYNASCNMLFLIDNWPASLTVAGPSAGMVSVQFPGGARHSQSTCGNQDIPEFPRLKLSPVLDNYLGQQLPVERVLSNYVLTDGFLNTMQNVDQSRRLDAMEIIASLVVYNETEEELQALLMHAKSILDEQEQKWLEALMALQSGDWANARKSLALMNQLSDKANDFVAIQQMRLQYITDGIDWTSLSETDSTKLLEIELRKGELAAFARNLIHIAKGGRPYRYVDPVKHKSDVSSGTFKKSALDNEVLIYPNPAKGNVQIDYALEGEELTLTAFDIFGKVITRSNLVSGINRTTIDVSEWVSGVYIISIENSGAIMKTHRLVVE